MTRMKKFNFNIEEYIRKGLVRNDNPLNKPGLIKVVGAVPYNKVLRSLESFNRIDTSSLSASFPYPQLFVLDSYIIVCTKTAIYEYDPLSQTLALRISGLDAGKTWDVLDYKEYIMLTNGAMVIYRDSSTGTYAISADVPVARCVCDYGGQVLIGSPEDNKYVHIEPEYLTIVATNSSDLFSIFYTSDLSNWVEANIQTGVIWRDITYSPELGMYVACGQPDTVNKAFAVSKDGKSWDLVSSPADGTQVNVRHIVWSREAFRFLAVVPGYGNSGPTILTSVDGENWETVSTNTAPVHRNPTYNTKYGCFLIGDGSVNTNSIIVKWTPGGSLEYINGNDTIGYTCEGLAYSPTLDITVGVCADGKTIYSYDTVNWYAGSGGGGDAEDWWDVLWVPQLDKFVAVGSSYPLGQYTPYGAMVSTDGKNWTLINAPNDGNSNQIVDVAWMHTMGKLIATTNTINQPVIYSSDGENWLVATTPFSSYNTTGIGGEYF